MIQRQALASVGITSWPPSAHARQRFRPAQNPAAKASAQGTFKPEARPVLKGFHSTVIHGVTYIVGVSLDIVSGVPANVRDTVLDQAAGEALENDALELS